MITKSKIKLIKSLARKKGRDQHQLFVVEGYKSIREFKDAGAFIIDLFTTQDAVYLNDLDPVVIAAADMKRISNLNTPPGYLAVVKFKEEPDIQEAQLILALDQLQDPGNLGTIIRLADWFNIDAIVCDHNTVDLYNPKCVQASMGSLARVNVISVDLEDFLEQASQPVFLTAMNGDSIYNTSLPEKAIIVMGSESHGVREKLFATGTSISIPQYGAASSATESLNVSSAAAITLAEWKRSTTGKKN
ncbi:TrmH family RNA methyltransferase [Nonlabens ponticola]|uniref:RNA methyltransferase n=1 Tax=Nonlabens ponticola TaxID=2496866 RepID=A0A3S9MUD7_9FLAO|nr:RNA methyltransferase [Nonlabens ponticola]AZQ42797.1 RNA methyltransferase [Nonlabens ponticola]